MLKFPPKQSFSPEARGSQLMNAWAHPTHHSKQRFALCDDRERCAKTVDILNVRVNMYKQLNGWSISYWSGYILSHT